jgi:hypothetical protein
MESRKTMTGKEVFSLNNEKLLQVIFRRTKDSMSTELDGETVILDLASGTYSGLDAVGTFIWNQLEQPATIAALRGAILGKYDVSDAQCLADLLDFLRVLADNGLIAWDEQTAG